MGMKEHFRHSRKITRGARWHVLRMAVLERDGWACVKCGSQKRLEVDHINPVRTHPELAHVTANLQALCPACHTQKTRLEIGFKPVPEDRQAWRNSVDALMRDEKGNEHKGKDRA
ncbi:MAG: HNH endonuclease [Pseudomonadota bacterium]